VRPEVWLSAGAVLSAVIAAASAYLSSRRASKQMAELENRKLEGATFDRNKAITDGIISDLRKEMDRLKAQVRELLQALDEKEDENEQLRRLLRDLTATANSLRFQVQVLERQLNGA
jgi:chromosome segregation ATPase